MINSLTIDQFIKKLQEAKEIIGGDKFVYFWNHPSDNFGLSLRILEQPMIYIPRNKGHVSFEIE